MRAGGSGPPTPLPPPPAVCVAEARPSVQTGTLDTEHLVDDVVFLFVCLLILVSLVTHGQD